MLECRLPYLIDFGIGPPSPDLLYSLQRSTNPLGVFKGPTSKGNGRDGRRVGKSIVILYEIQMRHALVREKKDMGKVENGGK